MKFKFFEKPKLPESKESKMIKLTTHFEDGSSGITEVKRPAGANPDSILVIVEGILEAEKTGKRVSKIGTSIVNPFSSPETGLVIHDNLVTREQALEELKSDSGGVSRIDERYKSLFC